MVSNIDAQRFMQLFRGKSNTYVKNELPRKAPETGEKFKTRITSVEGRVDKELVAGHLNGECGIGVCPVDADGRCFFGVLDIDVYGGRALRVLNIIKEYQLPLLPFRSKSGGLHVYMMFQKLVSAKTARLLLERISFMFCFEQMFGAGKVEIFPKQDRAEGFGSSVTLPYFNADDTYTYLMDGDGSPVDFKEALSVVQSRLTSVKDVEEAMDSLPYSDAPPCIQRALLSGAVGEGDSGRNNFLFSFAVYAKKKYGEDFLPYAEAVNASFEEPLSDADVVQTVESVRRNEYVYKCKDIPCRAFCQKGECRKREYGLGKDKGHFTGVDYGQLYRYMTAEPYYIWKLRLHGQEQWKDVVFKDEALLLDQKNFARMCVRYLNQAPMQVSNNDWYAVLNTVLPNVQDVAVSRESDTSELNAVLNAFLSYLSNKQAWRQSPYQIRAGLCVRQEEGGKAKYYFTHKGFSDYLKGQKVPFDSALLRETLKGFGAKEDILRYTNTSGELVSFPCWAKDEDEALEKAWTDAHEVEEGDRSAMTFGSYGEERKPYSGKDLEEAEKLF